MAASRFPKPIRIGNLAVQWIEREVLDFIASRPRSEELSPLTTCATSFLTRSTASRVPAGHDTAPEFSARAI